MLDLDTMRAIGRLAARQARMQAKDGTANEVIDYVPLLEPWGPGTSESPIDYAVGDVRTYNNQPWKCVQAHTHHGESGWEPGVAASLWANYHATDADHALPWIQPTGAHDMYKTNEYMIYTDGKIYKCLSDTNFSPTEYSQAWEVVE